MTRKRSERRGTPLTPETLSEDVVLDACIACTSADRQRHALDSRVEILCRHYLKFGREATSLEDQQKLCDGINSLRRLSAIRDREAK